MYRTVRYDPTEICCRYLTTNRFEDYIKQKFGNPKLPYGKDLSNFFNELSIFSQFFIWIADDLYNSPQLIFVNSIEDLLHPIDKNASPIEPGEKLHLPYWLGYIIVESINGHENIENFLLEDDGLKNFKRKIERTAKRYKEKNIADIFNRVSYYKTATHRIHCAIKPINLTHGEIAVFLIEHLGVEEELLVNDMNELLSFHWQWKNDFRRNKKFMYEKSLEVLEQDIWFLYEWLCSFHGGDGEAKFIERWSQDHTRCELGWTDIKEIVCYEEFAIEKNFIRSIPTYHNVLSTEAKDLNIIFKQLSHHNCFWPWARSFYDMHESLNTKGVVVYQQPRIVDNLIILTIRTEIVIRSIFSEWSEETQPDLKDIIKKASNSLAINDNEKKMLISIADNDWHLTDLRKMPEDVFQIIDDCETGAKNWGKKVCFIFKQILKFVTSRNYFAHNYYKDNDINQRSLFAKDILSACVDSLFYFNKILR